MDYFFSVVVVVLVTEPGAPVMASGEFTVVESVVVVVGCSAAGAVGTVTFTSGAEPTSCFA